MDVDQEMTLAVRCIGTHYVTAEPSVITPGPNNTRLNKHVSVVDDGAVGGRTRVDLVLRNHLVPNGGGARVVT